MIGKRIILEEDCIFKDQSTEIRIDAGDFTIVANYFGSWVVAGEAKILGCRYSLLIPEEQLNGIINAIKNNALQGSIIDHDTYDTIDNEVLELKEKLEQHRSIRDKLNKENQDLRDSLEEKTKALSLATSTIQNQSKNSSSEYEKHRDAIKAIADLL